MGRNEEKKPEVVEDDLVQKIVTHHVRQLTKKGADFEAEMTDEERAGLVANIAEQIGPSLHDMVEAACTLYMQGFADGGSDDDDDDDDDDDEGDDD